MRPGDIIVRGELRCAAWDRVDDLKNARFVAPVLASSVMLVLATHNIHDDESARLLVILDGRTGWVKKWFVREVGDQRER